MHTCENIEKEKKIYNARARRRRTRMPRWETERAWSLEEADSRDGEKERGRKCGLKMGEFSVGANFKGGALVGSNLLQVPETSNRQDIASSDRAESTDVTDTLNRFFYDYNPENKNKIQRTINEENKLIQTALYLYGWRLAWIH